MVAAADTCSRILEPAASIAGWVLLPNALPCRLTPPPCRCPSPTARTFALLPAAASYYLVVRALPVYCPHCVAVPVTLQPPTRLITCLPCPFSLTSACPSPEHYDACKTLTLPTPLPWIPSAVPRFCRFFGLGIGCASPLVPACGSLPASFGIMAAFTRITCVRWFCRSHTLRAPARTVRFCLRL